MKFFVLACRLVTVSVLFFSCQKEAGDASPPSLPEQTMADVAYGTDPRQKMDIYLPAGRNSSATKVIVLIHGGGWTQGDKSEFTPFVDTLKNRMPGVAVFNINYRLAAGSTHQFPAQENDVKAAIEFIFSKKSEYGISDKYALLGASAGAHLALLQAYKYTSPVSIKAVVDFFGPTDLVEMYNNPINPLIPVLLQNVTGGSPATQQVLYEQSSPVSFVTPQTPPTIILQGGADIVVDPAQSVILRNHLQAAGVVHQYVFYPAENHGWVGANLKDSFDKIQAFLSANFQ